MTRPKPQMAAWEVLVSGSERPTDTAPRVAVHTGAAMPAASSAWIRTGVSAIPEVRTGWAWCSRSSSGSRESTVVTVPGSGHTSASRAANWPRSGMAWTVTTSAPRSRRAATRRVACSSSVAPSGRATSHVPVSSGRRGSSPRRQVTR